MIGQAEQSFVIFKPPFQGATNIPEIWYGIHHAKACIDFVSDLHILSTTKVKSFVYMMQCAADDEENQKLGIVGLLYHVGDQLNKPDPELMAQGPATLHWVPIRFNSLHICVSHTMSSILARLLLIGAGQHIRCRSRVHFGTSDCFNLTYTLGVSTLFLTCMTKSQSGAHTECQYSLMTFGLPVHVFPIGGNSELKILEFQKWIKKQEIKEDAIRKGVAFDAIDLPSAKDVLMGKGKPFQLHPGNVKLRYLCERHLEDYSASRKGNKSELASKIVEQCGQFLKREANGWWTEVNAEVAKDKVIKAFLSIRANERSSSPEVPTRIPSPLPALQTASHVDDRDTKRPRIIGDEKSSTVYATSR